MNQQTICAAIRAKDTLKLRYDRDTQQRLFAPYIVYKAGTGNVLLAGYQINNPADPLASNEWRNLTVSKLKSVETSGGTFTVDPAFDPLDERYRGRVICCVSKYG